MANELVIGTLLGNQGDPVEYTVADGTAIPKGTLMEMTDPGTAIKVSGAGVPIAGITAVEKVVNSGVLKMACLTNVIVQATVGGSGTATLGSYVRSAGSDNTITVSTTLDHETGKGFAKSMETGGNSEVIKIRVAC